MFNNNQNEELNKISVFKCKEILNKNGNKYTDEEIKEIRDFLYVLVDINKEQYNWNNQKTKNESSNNL